ncbi:MAG: lysophospholipase L1-like esterase, partial [Planctomycetota bacterium]
TDRAGHTQRSSVLERLPSYIETVEKMSEKYGTRLVNLQDVFQRHLQYRDADTFCPEPVHPNRAGHLVIAEALMEELAR